MDKSLFINLLEHQRLKKICQLFKIKIVTKIILIPDIYVYFKPENEYKKELMKLRNMVLIGLQLDNIKLNIISGVKYALCT